MKKLFTLIAALLMLSASAETLSLYEHESESYFVPINSMWFDTPGNKTQVLYPAADLTDMVNKKITAITFYTDEDGVKMNGGTLDLYMGETDVTALTGYIDGLTKVGTVSISESAETELTLTFDTPYLYQGGNLVFGNVVTAAGNMTMTYFGGEAVNYNSGVYVGNMYGNTEFKQFLPKTTFTYEGGGAPVGHTYTVAGTQNLFGSFWNPADTTNDMVKGEGGIYTWTKNNVEMNMGDTIEFKVVEDHSWDNSSWPGENYRYVIPNNNTYDIVITFNPVNGEVNFTATGQNPVPEMVYTVVGPQDIFGSEWAPADTTNNMVKDEDGIYIWSKDDVALYGDFSFKVVGNHSYDIYQWPTVGNWDAHLTEGEGIYSILITFDPEAEPDLRITCTLTKTGSIAPVEHTYTVAGTENLFGSNWALEDEANDMVKGEDGIYTWTKNDVVFDAAATIEFRIVQDHAWTYAWPSGNWAINDVTEAGTYSFVITFNPAAADAEKIHVTVTKATQGLRGDVNGDNNVDITDATLLINYLLYGEAPGFNEQNANCDLQGGVDISDATALINFLLYGTWGD